MQETTEHSIIDKANKIYSIRFNSISEVISHLVVYNADEIGRFHRELLFRGIYIGIKYTPCFNSAYIEIRDIKETSLVFIESISGEKWFCGAGIKYICLKIIDELLDLYLAKEEEKSSLCEEKTQKQKELERKVVDDFVDKFKRKDKPSFWNFLFNWMK